MGKGSKRESSKTANTHFPIRNSKASSQSPISHFPWFLFLLFPPSFFLFLFSGIHSEFLLPVHPSDVVQP